MIVLALESSATPASAALMRDGYVLAQSYQNSGLTHSRTLLPMIEDMLKNTGTDKKDIDLIAVANGPGSFTGIRIGVATAKGLASALGIPCAGVSTLAGMAYAAIWTDRVVCAVMDARVKQVYNALFSVRDGKIERLCPDRALKLDELEKDLRERGGRYVLVGDGAKLCYNYFLDKGMDIVLAPEHLIYQTAYGIGLAAQCMPETVMDAADLVPTYLRPSQAERERQKRLEAMQDA